MTCESPLPAGSASPAAGPCRDVPQAGVPAFPPPDFDAAACGLEPGLQRRRFGPHWMVVGPSAVPAPPHLFVRSVQQAVERHYILPPGAMRSPRRDRAVARPRQLAMFLCRRLAGRTLPEIGRLFGDRDHTTVIHAVRTIEALRLSDPAIERDLLALCRALTTPHVAAGS